MVNSSWMVLLIYLHKEALMLKSVDDRLDDWAVLSCVIVYLLLCTSDGRLAWKCKYRFVDLQYSISKVKLAT